MDFKEQRKQYYLNNRDKILERCKRQYHDNKKERQKYNNECWALHGHTYMQKRSVDQNMKEKRKKYYNYNKDKL